MGHVSEDMTDMISFFREYPDYFLDYLKTENTMYDLLPFQRVYLRAFFRYKRVGIVASRGISKCVSGDTLIATENGLVKIGDLANWSKEERTDFQENKVVNIHGELEYSDVIFSNGFKDTKKITTKNGYQIEGTHVHPLLVLSPSGEMEFKKMSELKVGDKVAISRNGAFGNKVELDYDIDSVFDNKTGRRASLTKVPTHMTKDLAYFMGSIVGDGSMRSANHVLFSSADEESIEFMAKFVKDEFDREFKRRNDKYDYVIYSKQVKHFLNSLGIENVTAKDKKVPDSIMRAPKDMVASFLQGLFDTDGTTNGKMVSFTTASEEMSIQVQQLLLNFGIISSRKKRFNKQFETYSYSIYILSDNLDIFSREIGFRLTRKQSILEDGVVKRNSNDNVIYYQKDRLKRVLDKSNLTGTEKDYFKHAVKGNNNLSYDKLKFIYDNIHRFQPDEDLATLYGMYEDNLFWNEITVIEDSQNYVYDFHVPETHTFVGNGFVNHNTYLNVLAHYLKRILYPNNSLCLAMPTKEQSAKVVKEKIEEYWRDYPLLKNELVLNKCQFQKDYVKLVFKNGSTLDTLTVGESSRGLRAQGLSLEEIVDERMDSKTINEVLRPILAQPRMVAGYGVDKENEYSKTEAYVTTASHRQSYCYEKIASLYGEMIEGKPTIVLGTSYEMGTDFGTLDIEDVREKMDDPTYSPLSFDREYRSIFTGSSERSLVSADEINATRILNEPVWKASREDIKDPSVGYVLSYDVARAGTSANAKSALTVIKIIDRGDGTYIKHLVNIFTMEGTHFLKQSLFLKQKVKEYNARVLCIDMNGMGWGLVDHLTSEIDDNPPYSVINDERYNEYKKPNSIPMIFAVSSQSRGTKNSNIINHFMSVMANNDVKLLTTESQAKGFIKETDPYKFADKLLPFIQTDRLVDEIMNQEYINNGNTGTTKSVSDKIQKDRYSAFSYGLYWIYLEEVRNKNKRKVNFAETYDFVRVRKPVYKRFS